MPPLAGTPDPPYTAVIFTSVRLPATDGPQYAATAARMEELAAAARLPRIESAASDGTGLTVSYWRTPADATAWKAVAEHAAAQVTGRRLWYSDYRVRIATVERDYAKR